MINHLSLGVADLAAAQRFYDRFFAPLGHSLVVANENEIAYGPGGREAIFFLYPRCFGTDAPPPGSRTHVAFTAPSRAAVDAAFIAAMEGGGEAVRASGSHPDIAPDYYGCILFDPDGNKLEVVPASAAADDPS